MPRIGLLSIRAACVWAWAGYAVLSAAQPADSHFQLDVGLGHEAQTSPVFQISPEGNILYLDGSQGLSGSHLRTALQGSAHWEWEQGVSTALSADATFKRAPQAPDLDLASLSIQPSVHMPWGNSSVGWGLDLLSYDVGGRHFRDATGVQMDWTITSVQGLWGVVAEVSHYRHDAAFADMDATASSIVFLRQLNDPLPGVDGLDMSFIVGQEINDHGYADLSSHSAMLHADLRWTWLGADWSIGAGLRQARFDDSAFPGEPVRIDNTVMADLAAQWPLSASQSLRVEFNQVHNTSTTRLYDNTLQQLSLTFRTVW